jgi:uncharacterized protein (TIGR00369 family)
VALRRLTNSGWGFESNCFVCEPSNAAGMRIPFFHDEDGGIVRADINLDDRFSGAPNYVHGGVVLAILDEAMAWATIAISEKFAVTVESSARFLHPVRLGRGYSVEARVDEPGEEQMVCSAVLYDTKHRPCTEATATFSVVSAAQAADVIGAEVTGDDARYLR